MKWKINREIEHGVTALRLEAYIRKAGSNAGMRKCFEPRIREKQGIERRSENLYRRSSLILYEH